MAKKSSDSSTKKKTSAPKAERSVKPITQSELRARMREPDKPIGNYLFKVSPLWRCVDNVNCGQNADGRKRRSYGGTGDIA